MIIDIDDIKFDDRGLVPAIVQDYYTDEVLTLAYMNKESLEISIKEERTCFWSRSRKELWRKGETSGNTQRIVSITADCDQDALVVKVIKKGPACHLGNESCFSFPLMDNKVEEKFKLEKLYNLLLDRKEKMPKDSYTTYLFQKGKEKILKKVGEESTEVVIGAMKNDKEETVYEIADLCYHIMVLMVNEGISLDDVKSELASRHIIDHKIKQETGK
jgi:phosphoribosyl-ATP pyrophosphohydrolase/phosphoribosyl-AMP cyclohydrolase